MQLGVIGLSTMGANLARNAARNGANVLVFNRTTEKMEEFLQQYGSEGTFVGCRTLTEFSAAFSETKIIVIMVKAGDAVDAVITELLPLLKEGDILIDGGNSHYRDTERRVRELALQKIRFLGMGVSGGEEGALRGPSMMPGGDRSAFETALPLLSLMAAGDGEGGKCITYIGPGGSGHFVKMVHNGIEYGIMQLLAEAYHLLRTEGNYSNAELATLFNSWNNTPELQSFLVEITAKIVARKDDQGEGDLIDNIKDAAGQKGTGKWTTDAAMHYGVAVPTITAGVDSRIISSAKEFRVQRSTVVPVAVGDMGIDKVNLAAHVRSALELSILNVYAQGFQLLEAASREEQWQLQVKDIIRVWRGGCIIRAAVLKHYQAAFAGDRDASLLLRRRTEGERQLQWRTTVALGALRGIPLPALSASLSYFDAYRTARLPQNLIQAQRDLFGAHTYERLDRPGTFHTEWNRS